MTGVPCITVPAGYDSASKPVGLQFMGRWWEEHVLFRLAHAVEQDVVHRQPARYYNLMQ